MGEIFFIIKEGKRAAGTVVLPKALQKLSASVSAVSFGRTSAKCEVTAEANADQQIAISPDLWEALRLPFLCRAGAVIQNGTLRIGPLAGILAEGFDAGTPASCSLFERYVSAGIEAGCVPFVFSRKEISPDQHVISGWFYHDEKWVQHVVPVPDVVYNKLPSRKVEQSRTYRKVLSWLAENQGVPVFNPAFWDKWSVYEALRRDTFCRDLLPETVLDPSETEFLTMIEKYGQLYVKPKDGSHGKSVGVISKKRGSYECRIQHKGKVSYHTFQNAGRLCQTVFQNSGLLLQQGITLVRLNGNRTDFRFHTNKNAAGQWEVTAAAVKACDDAAVTTHAGSGGEVIPFSEFSKSAEAAGHLVKEIGAKALAISRVLEKHLQCPIGEIGFDFGLDTSGNVWLFEANAKPGRAIFNHPLLSAQDRKTLLMPFHYCRFLSGFTTKKMPQRQEWMSAGKTKAAQK